jgi:hypothetical protein
VEKVLERILDQPDLVPSPPNGRVGHDRIQPATFRAPNDRSRRDFLCVREIWADLEISDIYRKFHQALMFRTGIKVSVQREKLALFENLPKVKNVATMGIHF